MTRPSDLNYSMNITIAKKLGSPPLCPEHVSALEAEPCHSLLVAGERQEKTQRPALSPASCTATAVVVLEHNLRSSFLL